MGGISKWSAKVAVSGGVSFGIEPISTEVGASNRHAVGIFAHPDESYPEVYYAP